MAKKSEMFTTEQLKKVVRAAVCKAYGLDDPALIGDDYDPHYTDLYLLADSITSLVMDVLKFPGNKGSTTEQIKMLIGTIEQRFKRS